MASNGIMFIAIFVITRSKVEKENTHTHIQYYLRSPSFCLTFIGCVSWFMCGPDWQ
jgi:hypothetical protein